MQLAQIKKLAINTMIGSLIGSAAVAVLAILIGDFNDIVGKALFTLLIVALHALVSLGFLDSRTKIGDIEDLKFFTNTIFILIVLSFLTAVFGIWELIPGAIVVKLYGTYFIAAFATLHGEMLHKTTGLDARINNIVLGNYAMMTVVVVMLLPLLWLASQAEFPDFYYRLLSAAAIVDATLTILAVILHKLYLQKHPALKSELFSTVIYTVDANGNQVPQTVAASKRRMNPLLVVLGVLLLCQLIGPLVFLVAGMASH